MLVTWDLYGAGISGSLVVAANSDTLLSTARVMGLTNTLRIFVAGSLEDSKASGLAQCNPPTATPQPTNTAVPRSTATPVMTSTPEPTLAPDMPEDTPTAQPTAQPTGTPTPVATATPTPLQFQIGGEIKSAQNGRRLSASEKARLKSFTINIVAQCASGQTATTEVDGSFRYSMILPDDYCRVSLSAESDSGRLDVVSRPVSYLDYSRNLVAKAGQLGGLHFAVQIRTTSGTGSAGAGKAKPVVKPTSTPTPKNKGKKSGGKK